MRRATPIAVSLVLFSTCFGAPEKDTYHPLWNSRHYTNKEFPSEWRPENVPRTERDLAKFMDFTFDGTSIRSMIQRFGIPDRYLVLTRRPRSGEYNWLIYDLPEGYSAGFYVWPPPSSGFAAGVVIDPKGKLLRLIK